jgi:hypothetical protein
MPVVWILIQIFFDQIKQFEEMLLVGIFHEDVAEALNEKTAVFGSEK